MLRGRLLLFSEIICDSRMNHNEANAEASVIAHSRPTWVHVTIDNLSAINDIPEKRNESVVITNNSVLIQTETQFSLSSNDVNHCLTKRKLKKLISKNQDLNKNIRSEEVQLKAARAIPLSTQNGLLRTSNCSTRHNGQDDLNTPRQHGLQLRMESHGLRFEVIDLQVSGFS
jgi:hypothetical protein